MPEGPSIVLVKEAVKQFTGKKIIAVSSNSKIGYIKKVNVQELESGFLFAEKLLKTMMVILTQKANLVLGHLYSFSCHVNFIHHIQRK